MTLEHVDFEVPSGDSLELQCMGLLHQVMGWFDERRPANSPMDQETAHRIAMWFAAKYGGKQAV